MLKIRKYEKEDFENTRYVCLNSDGGGMSEEMRRVVLHLFCDYYLEQEGDNCFVLADGDDRAVGYIFCAEDFDKFKPVYEKDYAPLGCAEAEWARDWADNAYNLQEKFKSEYPAHLHIDILPEFQRGGWGGRLVETLVSHLRDKGISGVMLTAGTDNTLACNFYKKYGFNVLEIQGTDIAFGKKF